MSGVPAPLGEPRPESSSEGMLNIRFKTMEPANYDVCVPSSATVASLKSDHLAPKVNAPAERQRIIFKGRALRDDQTLRDAGIENNDTLHLVIRPADMPSAGAGTGQQQPMRAQGEPQPAPSAGPPSATAQGQQQQQVPGTPDSNAPAWLQAPHLVSAINGFLETLQAPNYVPLPMPLAWHPLPPAVDQRLALSRLTDGLREVLQGVYLPAELRALLESSQADREGRDPGAAPASAPAPAASAATTPPSASAAPSPPLSASATLLGSRQAQHMPNFSDYRYIPLAVAALAELTRRADTHISSSLTRRMRELSGAIMALAGDNRNRMLEQHVQVLGQLLSASAALLTELARLATGLNSALQGNAAPLVFSRPTMLQPNGSNTIMPILQPQMGVQQGMPGGFPGMPGGFPGMPAGFPGMPGGFPGMPGGFPGMPGGLPGGMPGMMPPGVPGPPRPGAMNDMIQQLLQRSMQQLGAALPGGATAQAGTGAAPPGGPAPRAADAGGAANAAAPGGGPEAPAPMNLQGAIRIDIVDDGSGGDISAALGPLLNGMLGPMMGGMPMPDMSAVLQQHQQQVNLQRMMQQQQMEQQQQQQQQASAARAGAQPSPAAAPGPPGEAQAGRERQPGVGSQLSSYLTVLRPLIRMIASSAANTVSQRLIPLQPLLQSPAQTGQLVGTLVSEVLNESMSSVIETWATHEEQINAALEQMQSAEVDGPSDLVQLAQVLVGNIMHGTMGRPPGAPAVPATATAAAPAATAAAPAPAAPAAASAAPGPAADSPAAVPEATVATAPMPVVASPAATEAVEQPRSAAAAAGDAAAARQLQAAGLTEAAPAAGAECSVTPASCEAAAPAPADAAASSSSAPAAARSQAGPRGLGMGLKPVVKKKPAATPAADRAAGVAGTAAAAGPEARSGGGGAGASSLAAAAPAPDMGNLMAMVGRMMSGAGGGGGLPPGLAAPGAGGDAGLGGLLQMATSLANDPSMQPMLQNAMSSLMGGGGGVGGAGGAGGLGGLLGNLMGSMGGMGAGAAAPSRSHAQVEEVVDLDVLERELEPEAAARWRSIIEQDEQQQQQQQAAGASGSESEPRFSEVYEAGLPQQTVSLMESQERS